MKNIVLAFSFILTISCSTKYDDAIKVSEEILNSKYVHIDEVFKINKPITKYFLDNVIRKKASEYFLENKYFFDEEYFLESKSFHNNKQKVIFLKYKSKNSEKRIIFKYRKNNNTSLRLEEISLEDIPKNYPKNIR